MLKFVALLSLLVYHVSAAPCCCSNCNTEYEAAKQTKIVKRIEVPAPFNWTESDQARLNNQHAVLVHQSPTFVDPTQQVVEMKLCEDGWEVYQDSCYYHEREEKMTLEMAEKRCNKLGATLFVANTKQEFETIVQDAPMNYFTWTGLYKKMDGDKPQWQTSDGIDTDAINWVIKPYNDGGNGWTTASQCAAHWNPFTTVGKYTFWYPCSYQYYFICERNATLQSIPHYKTKHFFV